MTKGNRQTDIGHCERATKARDGREPIAPRCGVFTCSKDPQGFVSTRTCQGPSQFPLPEGCPATFAPPIDQVEVHATLGPITAPTGWLTNLAPSTRPNIRQT